MSIQVIPLTRERQKTKAIAYLAQAHPSGSIPIPIEEIIDVKEKIDIVPVEDLCVDGHEAFTAKDGKTIYVDLGVYRNKNQNRYRFTIAHELSHILLHDYIFKSASYTDIAGFKRFMGSIGDGALKEIEQQAYIHAGFLLVPSDKLSDKYDQAAATLRGHGLDIKKLTPQGLKSVAKEIGTQFGVSSNVIHRRAVYDGLWRWDDFPGD